MWMDLFFDCIFHMIFDSGASLHHKWGAEASGGRIWRWGADYHERAGALLTFHKAPRSSQIFLAAPGQRWSSQTGFKGERPDKSRACDTRSPVRPHPGRHQHHSPYLWKVPVLFVQNRDWFFNLLGSSQQLLSRSKLLNKRRKRPGFWLNGQSSTRRLLLFRYI